MRVEELRNKKIAILGFGKEGQSALHFLQDQGIEDNIFILDKQELSSEYKKYPHVTGERYLDKLDDFDIIIKTPGISPFQKKILPYREKCITATEIFFSYYSGKVIGITGTKGKSTVSSLLYTCLQNTHYKVKLVGNIGTPVLDEIPYLTPTLSGEEREQTQYDYIVYEMSSYMLQDFIPILEIGMLNNIYPCHLDWHYDSMNIYKQAKLNILRNAQIQIVNGDFSMDGDIADIPGKKVYFHSKGLYSYEDDSFYIGDEKVFSGDIALLGEHNKKNICGVIAILDQILQDREELIRILDLVLPDFVGLPNRIEDIGVYEGIRFINDAIATTPESSIAAIETFDHDIQTLFLGGEDSGFRFEKIREKILESKIINIIAFPNTSEKIFPEIEARDYEKAFEIEIEGKILQMIKTRSMKVGVDFAYKTTLPGKVALLSCAAPSFSLWKSYLEKAEEFKREVKNY